MASRQAVETQGGGPRRYGFFMMAAGFAVLATAAAVNAVTSDEDRPGGARAKHSLRETLHREFELTPGSALTIANENGGVEIVGYDGDTVKLSVQKRLEVRRSALGYFGERVGFSPAVSPEIVEMFERADLRVQAGEGSAEVSTSLPVLAPEASITFNFRIKVPRDTDLNVHTENGRVMIIGIHGRVVVASENGKVECENIAGDVEARTHNGGIYCKRIDGGIVARTKNGPILVDGRDATEGFPIHLETDNGPIKLRLAEGASFDLVARTSNGQVRTGVAIDGAVPRGARRKLAGPVGSGGPTIELRSANGSIYLNNS